MFLKNWIPYVYLQIRWKNRLLVFLSCQEFEKKKYLLFLKKK